MNLNGKLTLFVAKREIEVDGNKKVVVDLTTTISSKLEDGKYLNKKVRVHLAGKSFPEEAVAKLEEGKCYTMEVSDGFLAVNGWKDSRGNDRRDIEFVITKGRLTSSKEVVRPIPHETNSDLPF